MDKKGYYKLLNITKQATAVLGYKQLKYFSFSHFIEFIKIDDKTKRLFYEVETIKANWSIKE